MPDVVRSAASRRSGGGGGGGGGGVFLRDTNPFVGDSSLRHQEPDRILAHEESGFDDYEEAFFLSRRPPAERQTSLGRTSHVYGAANPFCGGAELLPPPPHCSGDGTQPCSYGMAASAPEFLQPCGMDNSQALRCRMEFRNASHRAVEHNPFAQNNYQAMQEWRQAFENPPAKKYEAFLSPTSYCAAGDPGFLGDQNMNRPQKSAVNAADMQSCGFFDPACCQMNQHCHGGFSCINKDQDGGGGCYEGRPTDSYGDGQGRCCESAAFARPSSAVPRLDPATAYSRDGSAVFCDVTQGGYEPCSADDCRRRSYKGGGDSLEGRAPFEDDDDDVVHDDDAEDLDLARCDRWQVYPNLQQCPTARCQRDDACAPRLATPLAKKMGGFAGGPVLGGHAAATAVATGGDALTGLVGSRDGWRRAPSVPSLGDTSVVAAAADRDGRRRSPARCDAAQPSLLPPAGGKAKRKRKRRRAASYRKAHGEDEALANEGAPAPAGVGGGALDAGASAAQPDDPAPECVFTLKIHVPGSEPFELQVSSQELVQDIQQVLMDREESCHRTCFSLQLDGAALDAYSELRAVEGLGEGSLLRVVEEPYTIREVRIHLRHVRDLLKSTDLSDAYNGQDGVSLSFLNAVTDGDVAAEGVRRKRRPGFEQAGSESVDCTPPEYILPGSRERLLCPLQPLPRDYKPLQCLKVLTTSGWNPPPGNRRMHGDLMYLYVVTAEDRHVSITASTRGFYLNQSTAEVFNPKSASPSHLSHSLVELLALISPTFKKNFAILQKKRVQRHPLERMATPFQVYSWTAPQLEHTVDCVRAEEAYTSRLGYEEHIPGQTRDWNEEIQATRELPHKNLTERLLRDRAIFKVQSDFTAAAARGAMAVADGNVMAINPGEDARTQMFLWNNIFFSLGFDVRDHYKAVGGDAAAHVAPALDLAGVRAVSALDPEGLHVLATALVDYRGYRVTAQSVIPGILEREQEQAIAYGSLDFGATVACSSSSGKLTTAATTRKFTTLLERVAKPLHILRHKVLNEKDEAVELCSSVECKGIVGNDGRHYILDLIRTFPPDANFLPMATPEATDDVRAAEGDGEETGAAQEEQGKKEEKEEDQEEEQGKKKKEEEVPFPEVCTSLGFPRAHRHRLPCLRHELVDAFVQSKHQQFMHLAISQHKALKKEGADEAQGTDDAEMNGHDVMRNACRAVGSVNDAFFDIRFNPDVFTPTVRFPESERESVQHQKRLLFEAAAFLVSVQMPAFLKDCMEQLVVPMDGSTLVEALHRRGIGLRYLGTLARMITGLPDARTLSYLHSLVIVEIITRSAKHLLRTYLQNTDLSGLSIAVAHFLNCFLSACSNPGAPSSSSSLSSSSGTAAPGAGGAGAANNNNSSASNAQASEDAASSAPKGKRRGRRRNQRGGHGAGTDSGSWAALSPQQLWKSIRTEAREYYAIDLECDGVDQALEKYGIQKLALLREICLKGGIQVLLREYNFEGRHKATFTEEDILNMFPVVKHLDARATDAQRIFQTAQAHIQQGFFKEGCTQLGEALNLYNGVYGALHAEIIACLRLLARLHYILGDHGEALSCQEKATMMSERVLGIDSPYTIQEYMNFALYCFTNAHISAALKLLYRGRYLALLLVGEDHPQMAVFDSNIGLMLHGVSEYELALRFLEKAHGTNVKYAGGKCLRAALSHHLLARVFSSKGDFRSALQHEKETYTIYKAQFGDVHEKTVGSSEYLKHLTQQAVALQRTMNEIYKNGAKPSIAPPQISAPSMQNILELLNAVNGIVLPTLGRDDIIKLKAEVQQLEAMVTSHKQAFSEKGFVMPEDEAADDDDAAAAATSSSAEAAANGVAAANGDSHEPERLEQDEGVQTAEASAANS
ncbi:clustered mitochondria protein homolog isoform X1 [Lethenteron reissneri]|uniref:clustered mitochondria protein homolog isoform X1 n=1 Tax=Lethenteron reissneri TaxID=7753 RepID=UPI002AB63453|nr:clustered mitochondria protein homolog isoform X1 [Lethenteron reissneri]